MQLKMYFKQYSWCSGIVTIVDNCKHCNSGIVNLFYTIKILTKSSVTPKIMIVFQKHLFNLIPKSISKFPKV